MKQKFWLLILVLAVTIALSAGIISADEWWNNDWANRIPVHIQEETGSDQYGALIEVEVDTYSLIGDGLMRADCDDIRVIDYSENKLLSYEVDDCEQTKTKIKFRANVPANHNGVLALIYYGNLDAESAETEISAWVTKTGMNVPRKQLASAVHNDKIYAIGGYTTKQVDDNEMYNPATGSWISLEDVPIKVSGPAATTSGNRIYVAGGYSSGAHAPSLFSYVPVTDTWSSPKANMSTARTYLVLEAVDGKLYAIGGIGRDQNDNSKIYSNVEEYTPSTNTWATKTSMPIAKKEAASVVVDGEIYVIGGMTLDGSSESVEVYDPEDDEWDADSIADMPLASPGCKAVVLDGKIYVFRSTAKNNVFIYDIDENAWERGEDMPTVRNNFAVETANGKIYVFGSAVAVDACEGTAKACDELTTKAECGTETFLAQHGCEWRPDYDPPACSRTATACSELTETQCQEQIGCTWSSPGSGIDEYSAPNIGLTVSTNISKEEVCDGFDNDADGETDEEGVCNTIDNCGSYQHSCYTENVLNASCEDAVCVILECEEDYYDADSDTENGCECTITNNGTEIVDGLDNDCDGTIDFPGEDNDNDGFTTTEGDCDDTDPRIYPNATESCNRIDDDCDTIIDEGCPGGGQSIFDQTLATSYTVGNGECEAGEDQENAPVDCGCPDDLVLVGNTCRDPSDVPTDYIVGDNYCDKDEGETKENSPEDCKSPVGKYVAVILAIVGIGALVYYAYEHYPRIKLDELTEKHEVASPKASASTLKGYIDSCLSKGFPKNQIRDALLKRGWGEDKVEEALE